MLVLSRKPRESIRIGDDIVVTLLAIQGKKVRVGIEAPKAIRALRHNILEFSARVLATWSARWPGSSD